MENLKSVVAAYLRQSWPMFAAGVAVGLMIGWVI